MSWGKQNTDLKTATHKLIHNTVTTEKTTENNRNNRNTTGIHTFFANRANPTKQMYTQRLARGPIATTPTSAATDTEADMYFCTI